MSGGSLSYLYNKEFPEVCNYIDEMETVEKELISQGYTDIAKDVRRLIEYCLTARNRIGVLFENLSDVFHAVEWRYSSDYGDEEMLEVFDEYREGKDKQTDAEKVKPAEKQYILKAEQGETDAHFRLRLISNAILKGTVHGEIGGINYTVRLNPKNGDIEIST